jgi:hypothetical protein
MSSARAPAPVRGWRTLLVWLHAVTSIGWLSQAMAMLVLAVVSRRSAPAEHDSVLSVAHLLDRRLLANLANASAFTGFMLSALTPWGYARSWWVLVKAVLTVIQLVLGVTVLDAARADAQLPLVVLMVCCLGLQAWLSVAKPWGRTSWSRRPGVARPLTGSRRAYVWALVVTVADLALGIVAAGPRSALSLGTLLGYTVLRSRRMHRTGDRPDPAID